MRSFFLLVLGCLLAAPLSAQSPAQYTWTFALGAIAPLDSGEGVITPVLVANYDPTSDASFRMHYKTSKLALRYRPEAGPWALLSGVEVISTGDPGAFYYQGRRQRAYNFAGHSPYLGIGYLLMDEPKTQWLVEGVSTRYIATPVAEATDPGLKLPADQGEQRIGTQTQGQQGGLSWDASAYRLQRESQPSWQLNPEPQTEAHKAWGKLGYDQAWAGVSTLEAEFGAGSGLDLFTGFSLGGIGSPHQIPGYYRAEFRARSFGRLAVKHKVTFEGGARLFGSFEAAQFKSLELFGPESFDSPAGFSLGGYYPIQSLKGLPVILIYGQGVGGVPENSPEDYRRQLALMLAAAF
ncbi:MAG: hypothetical protein RRB13_10530 [bacterium]|nr:hypothetical protein [bacterium]